MSLKKLENFLKFKIFQAFGNVFRFFDSWFSG